MARIQTVTKSLISGNGIVRTDWRVDLDDGSSFAPEDMDTAQCWAIQNTPSDDHANVHARFDAIVDHYEAVAEFMAQ